MSCASSATHSHSVAAPTARAEEVDAGAFKNAFDLEGSARMAWREASSRLPMWSASAPMQPPSSRCAGSGRPRYQHATRSRHSASHVRSVLESVLEALGCSWRRRRREAEHSGCSATAAAASQDAPQPSSKKLCGAPSVGCRGSAAALTIIRPLLAWTTNAALCQ